MNNKKTNILLTILIILVSLFLIIMTYWIFFKDKPEEKTDTNKIVFSGITYEEIQRYYDYVETDFMLVDKFVEYDESTKTYSIKNLKTKDMDSEVKIYYGYRQLSNHDIYLVQCSEYKNLKLINDVTCFSTASIWDAEKYECDDDAEGNQICKYTDVIDESTLKGKVEEVFGEKSYNFVAKFNIPGLDGGYFYNSTKMQYILVGIRGGVTFPFVTSLISATKDNNEIILIEKLSTESKPDIEQIFEIKHIFKKAADGNYYYDGFEKN